MNRPNVIDVIGGSTVRLTCRFIDPNADPQALISELRSGSETLVGSVAAVASGSGMFFALHTIPNTPAWYVNRWVGALGVNTYVMPQYLRVIVPEID